MKSDKPIQVELFNPTTSISHLAQSRGRGASPRPLEDLVVKGN